MGLESRELFHVFQVLTSQVRLASLLPEALDLCLELIGAERAFFILYDSKGELTIHAARNQDGEDLEQEEFPGSMTIVGKVLESKKPLYLPEIPPASEFGSALSVRKLRLQSAICLPLLNQRHGETKAPEVLGVLYSDSSISGPQLTEKDVMAMQTLANYVTLAVSNARLFEEVLEKNHRIENLNHRLQQKVESQAGDLAEMKVLLAETQREVGKTYGLGNIIGGSKPMLKLFKALEKVVRTEATVLILGESGTGKELIARYIHYNGRRAASPMVSVNCSAFSETLLESELFGHEKGAFTGAHTSKTGLFQLADGGTLFLDEVGDMSLEMQSKLLRVIQDGEIRPLGGRQTHHVDVRIISATNRDIDELLRSGRFREDLYFRLNVITLKVPPLRERCEDIPLLIEYFTGRISDELKCPLPKPSPEIYKRFMEHNWPGNVRELENELRRLFILESEYEPAGLGGPTQPLPKDRMNLEELEKNAILRALEAANGNKTRAAALLGITRRSFYKKLVRFNIY